MNPQHTPTFDIEKELANIATRIAEDGCQCTDAILCRVHAVLVSTRHIVNAHDELLEASKEALCELDPDCKYDGFSGHGETLSIRERAILNLYETIAKAEKGE